MNSNTGSTRTFPLASPRFSLPPLIKWSPLIISKKTPKKRVERPLNRLSQLANQWLNIIVRMQQLCISSKMTKAALWMSQKMSIIMRSYMKTPANSRWGLMPGLGEGVINLETVRKRNILSLMVMKDWYVRKVWMKVTKITLSYSANITISVLRTTYNKSAMISIPQDKIKVWLNSKKWTRMVIRSSIRKNSKLRGTAHNLKLAKTIITITSIKSLKRGLKRVHLGTRHHHLPSIQWRAQTIKMSWIIS